MQACICSVVMEEVFHIGCTSCDVQCGVYILRYTVSRDWDPFLGSYFDRSHHDKSVVVHGSVYDSLIYPGSKSSSSSIGLPVRHVRMPVIKRFLASTRRPRSMRLSRQLESMPEQVSMWVVPHFGIAHLRHVRGMLTMRPRRYKVMSLLTSLGCLPKWYI